MDNEAQVAEPKPSSYAPFQYLLEKHHRDSYIITSIACVRLARRIVIVQHDLLVVSRPRRAHTHERRE